jgi:hypothetical protein
LITLAKGGTSMLPYPPASTTVIAARHYLFCIKLVRRSVFLRSSGSIPWKGVVGMPWWPRSKGNKNSEADVVEAFHGHHICSCSSSPDDEDRDVPQSFFPLKLDGTRRQKPSPGVIHRANVPPYMYTACACNGATQQTTILPVESITRRALQDLGFSPLIARNNAAANETLIPTPSTSTS